jgi:hypothetical protein
VSAYFKTRPAEVPAEGIGVSAFHSYRVPVFLIVHIELGFGFFFQFAFRFGFALGLASPTVTVGAGVFGRLGVFHFASLTMIDWCSPGHLIADDEGDRGSRSTAPLSLPKSSKLLPAALIV